MSNPTWERTITPFAWSISFLGRERGSVWWIASALNETIPRYFLNFYCSSNSMGPTPYDSIPNIPRQQRSHQIYLKNLTKCLSPAWPHFNHIFNYLPQVLQSQPFCAPPATNKENLLFPRRYLILIINGPFRPFLPWFSHSHQMRLSLIICWTCLSSCSFSTPTFHPHRRSEPSLVAFQRRVKTYRMCSQLLFFPFIF